MGNLCLVMLLPAIHRTPYNVHLFIVEEHLLYAYPLNTFGLNNTVCIVISYASCSYYMHAVKPVNGTKTRVVVGVTAATTAVAWYVDDAAT